MRRILPVLLLFLTACAPQRTLYMGGPIITMDGENSVAEALLVEGDRIAAVGGRAEVAHAAGPKARVVDLKGRALLPGFIDAHGHFPGVGVYALQTDLRSPPVGDVADIDELVARLSRQAAGKGKDEWIVGVGYDDTLLADNRQPTRYDLDRVSTTQPVAIWHISFHVAVVNSRGLELMGVTASTPDPEGGRFQRDPVTAEPNGVLEENATDWLRDQLMNLSLFDTIKIVKAASHAYVSEGVTTAQNGLVESEKNLRGLELMSRLGVIPLRLVEWPGESLAREMDAEGGDWTSYDDEWVDIGAVKLIADGSIQAYTAYLTEPYYKAPEYDADYRGYPRIEAGKLDDLVREFHARGHQIAVHGNGDSSIDDILDAFEAAQRANPRPDARPIIIHAQMTRPDQLDRMRELGVIPSFFVSHTYYWGDRHREIFLGPERAAAISPLRSALDRGVRFTLHTDTPVVPMSPLRILWSACTRKTSSGLTLGADERIPMMAALRAITIDAAYEYFQEDEKGSLERGKLADLVILSGSPLDDPEHVYRLRVLETVIGGRTVYEAVGGK